MVISSSRWEKRFVIGFILSFAIVPLFAQSYFPFTSMPMFSGFLDPIALARVYDQSGQELPLLPFSLHLPEIFNPSPRIGRTVPESRWRQHSLLTDKELEAVVATQVERYPLVYIEQWMLEKRNGGMLVVEHRFKALKNGVAQ